MKKWEILFVGSILSLSIMGTANASNQMFIRFSNGMEEVLPQGAKVEDGQLLVPIRWMAKELGSTVDWNEQDNAVEVKITENRLLKAQINHFIYGLQARTPKEAVELWIQGVKNRSGSVQYATLSPTLQKKRYDEFERNYWGTGGSSPWINHVNFTKEEKISDTKIKYTIEYDLAATKWNWDKGEKVITVEKNPELHRETWYITDISTKYNEHEMFTPAETIKK